MTATTTRIGLARYDPISLDGRYASQTAPDLERTLRESIDAGVFRIVLDMGKVTHFGSAAIRTLSMAYKERRRLNRGAVHVANVNNQVRQVFELAGILPLTQHFGGG